MPTPSIWLSSCTFNDRKTIEFGRSDIVVIVGGNNSGKSELLRNIRDKTQSSQHPCKVIDKITLASEGSTSELIEWLRQVATVRPENPNTFFRAGVQVPKQVAEHHWNNPANGLHQVASFFCYHLSADARLSAAEPASNIAFTSDPLTHPIHYLYANDSLERSLSDKFKSAFGQELVVNRAAGNQIPLHCGTRPILKEGEDRVSLGYVSAVGRLPMIHTQGDGMRAYVGILLHTLVVNHSVLLIDEPEAFLHPPQIRQLARLIATEHPVGEQVFIATHSGDFLRGILDAPGSRVRILRLNRVANINHVTELGNADVQEILGGSVASVQQYPRWAIS